MILNCIILLCLKRNFPLNILLMFWKTFFSIPIRLRILVPYFPTSVKILPIFLNSCSCLNLVSPIHLSCLGLFLSLKTTECVFLKLIFNLFFSLSFIVGVTLVYFLEFHSWITCVTALCAIRCQRPSVNLIH